MVRILWEVSVTRVIVLLLGVVALDMVRWMVYGVLIMVNTSVFVQIIIVRVRHGIVEVEQIVVVAILEMLMLALVGAILVIVVMPVTMIALLSITKCALFTHAFLDLSLELFLLSSHLRFVVFDWSFRLLLLWLLLDRLC